MSHTAGVSGWEEKITADQVCDVEYSTAKLAEQAPWWEPGTASGYHAVTMGHLLGEVIKRTTGKPMKQFVADEIAGPTNADFQIGCVEKDWPRISLVIPPPPPPWDLTKMDPQSAMVKTFSNPGMDARNSYKNNWRHSDMSAVNGHGNARSLNKILSAIPNGGVTGGVRLLKPETIELIFREQSDGRDLVIGLPMRFGIGYAINGGGTAETVSWLPTEKMCFWGGWGGSLELMDLHRNMTFTYVMNLMGPGTLGNENTEAYVKEVYNILKEEGDSLSGKL
jgi:CubicO group peptidase (beta-lactamase class C family)